MLALGVAGRYRLRREQVLRSRVMLEQRGGRESGDTDSGVGHDTLCIRHIYCIRVRCTL